MSRRHVLILGGTAEAASLAAGLTQRFGEALKVTSSLAGRTSQPAPLAGNVRTGGFADWLRAERVDLIVDATHPFAEAISANAVAACDRLGIPRLRLQRPAWRKHPLDRWIEVATLDAAAKALVDLESKRAFLTVGAQELAPFAGLESIWFLIRLIDPPRAPLGLGPHEIVLGRGPFALAEERHLLAHHRIDTLVTKASGGSATEAKLTAAREGGLPVIMVQRPPPPAGPLVETAEAALDWVMILQ
jgi:precorrin-6A/cobalt-precorrin-6A reductase